MNDQPTAPTACPIASAVAADVLARAEVGLRKYGVSLARPDLSRAQWLQHAYEEALDLAAYLKTLIEMEKADVTNKAAPALERLHADNLLMAQALQGISPDANTMTPAEAADRVAAVERAIERALS